VVGFLPKEFMDRMSMPADIFTTRAPDEVASAMQRAGFADVELVLGGAACMAAGVHDQRAALGEAPVAASEGVRIEERRRGLVVDAPRRPDAVL